MSGAMTWILCSGILEISEPTVRMTCGATKWPAGLFSIISGSYDFPAAHCLVDGVYTNKAPGGVAYRCSFRVTEAAYCIERAMDIMAQKLGMDPAEFRMKNLIRREQFPYTSAFGWQYDSGDYQTALKKAMELVDYKKLREEQKAKREAFKRGETRELMGIIDPHLNWGEQEKSIRLEVDQDRARALGLTPLDVAQTMQTMLSGYTVTQYREGIETIDVVARAVSSERLVLDRLSELTISTQNGVAVPLSQIARLRYEYEEPILWRRNRDLVLTARADVVDGVQPPDVSAAIEPQLQSIKDALPYGYRIETGGATEESAKANKALNGVVTALFQIAVPDSVVLGLCSAHCA